ncbi:FAMA [Hibiscus trionum]|uniref:FAMA n=1 Tax=Hibiscus trionum TaxID=183268 RepID=A0A9W7LGN7_HIBTR|nr:FAMA [Hibiscus trionum]
MKTSSSLDHHDHRRHCQDQQHMSSSGFCNTLSTCSVGEDDDQSKNSTPEAKNKRKRPRTTKTSEEIENRRVIHIAVERNRRKQMAEHLRVLRTLMPASYVQRGDQASIVGGAIEFVSELEQLLEGLESQKARRLYGEASLQQSSMDQRQQQPLCPPMSLPKDRIELIDYDSDTNRALYDQTAESKSSLADVQVKLLGSDAMINILSKTRPGQLVRTIAALEGLNLNLLQTNITTIEQAVLYSFNVKVESESRLSAEDIASSVQQVFSFVDSNSRI